MAARNNMNELKLIRSFTFLTYKMTMAKMYDLSNADTIMLYHKGTQEGINYIYISIHVST